jgi:hypothetical protein
MVLVDADILAYRIGWAMEKEDARAARMALDSFTTDLLCGAGREAVGFQLYLTGDTAGNFRHKVATTLPYKGNRSGTGKPKHWQMLRDYMVSDWNAIIVEGMEADDAIASANFIEPDCTMVSVDKDFLQCVGHMYDPVKRKHIHTDEWEGLCFLYKQIIMGDMTDNIQGVKGVGEVGATKALAHCTTEEELYQAALTVYKGDATALLETARLVYLRLIPGEWWVSPQEREYGTGTSDTGNPVGDTPPINDECGDGISWDSSLPERQGVN